jgi:hypothetical protein
MPEFIVKQIFFVFLAFEPAFELKKKNFDAIFHLGHSFSSTGSWQVSCGYVA